MTEADLIAAARAAAGRAHAPYSNFAVGCAVESVAGEVAVGANVENACFRLGLCAEQAALAAAQVAFGLDQVARIAVVAISGDKPVTPCGGCRQAILEAAQLSGIDIEIICAGADRTERHTIAALLPHCFGPDHLIA